MSAPRLSRARRALPILLLAVGLPLAACADFSAETPTFTVQPSLTARAAVPDESTPGAPPTVVPPTDSGTPPTSGSAPSADPCAPTDDAVIATCLSAPWGLAPLPDGQSALVGERTTGRILKVAKGAEPELVAQIDGVDGSGDGGLLGLVLSPSYAEDDLIYAYVTTAEDNRIIRLAAGDVPKAIFTGIPKGATHNGGRIAFAADRSFYVGTGDTGNPALAGDPASLAGKVLRLDEFGKPAASNPTPGSAVYATGLSQVTGMCALSDGTMAALDRRPTSDVLLPLTAGKSYGTLAEGDALWTWSPADGGAVACAVTNGVLASTSLDKEQLSALQMAGPRTFTGSPTVLLDNRYGRLLTVTADSTGLLWLTTSNKDGVGRPVPSDDRVVVVPSGGGGEGGLD
jgi:glucose/arabinose dehydrogenase